DSEGIWQRWRSYADVNDLTGGNKTFEQMKNDGADRIIDNFTYTILEIFDMRTKPEVIIQREEYWKRVFQSVAHGMNN
ncbi:MAG: GIY-YIG nuclease family protein, partial [Christensenellaceae bacterium]